MLLLHTCCAPCSLAVIEWMLSYNIHPVLFFFNPNIHPRREYEIRKNELIRYAQSLNLLLINRNYDHKFWLKAIKGLEKQPEKGLRCLECFKIRLLATTKLANEKKIKKIATTLTSSRWKDIDQVTKAGKWAVSNYPNIKFCNKNWKKDGLFERKQILLQNGKFYNQSYCGCEFNNKKL